MIRDMETNRKRWLKYELGKFKTKLVIKTYVKMLMSGKVEWERLANMYRPDQKQPVLTLKRFFKQRETINMITEELKEKIEDCVEKLEQAIKTDMYIHIKDSFDELQASSYRFAEFIYANVEKPPQEIDHET
ncbi:MAG: hypothetical protein IH784_07615 [Bacteroidetes bacterium]|nr:hypothetical protein [Bacteroidota bacterium]